MTRRLLCLLFVLNLATMAMAQRPSVSSMIEKKLSRGDNSIELGIEGVRLYAQREIPAFYHNRNYEPAWNDINNVNDLLESLEMAYEEGLDRKDYHYDRIMELIGGDLSHKLSNEEKADLDIILTDALILYMAHLLGGKLEQSELRMSWDVQKNQRPANVDSLLTVTLHNHRIKEVLDQMKPAHYMYDNLKGHLKRLREQAEGGGWPRISIGKTLKIGMDTVGVEELRSYLLATGDLEPAEDRGGSYFNRELESAVKRFQKRHGLDEDGSVGSETLTQMQVPIEKRIEMLLVNLERLRWVFHHPDEDFLMVNIAGFELRRFTNRKEVFHSRVIVGKLHRKTPVFKGVMRYIVINPSWILPYSISTSETLPMLQEDPNYLVEQHLEVLDSSGMQLDASGLDWHQYSRGNFPFIIKQKPGPWNALGEVKFMFPNKYLIYLHDTPSRGLFERSERTFSHGCIRTEDVWGLFFSLMGDTENWNREKIDELLESGETTKIELPKPINIYILYLTSAVDQDNLLYFMKDIYKRDRPVMELLLTPRDP